MAAPGCIAAARECFLLAALHSVAERVNPRKAPTGSACPGLLASAARPHCRCWEKSRTRTSPLAIFPTLGAHASLAIERGTELLAVAAQACGAVCGQTGTNHLGWYACPRLTLFATEWS